MTIFNMTGPVTGDLTDAISTAGTDAPSVVTSPAPQHGTYCYKLTNVTSGLFDTEVKFGKIAADGSQGAIAGGIGDSRYLAGWFRIDSSGLSFPACGFLVMWNSGLTSICSLSFDGGGNIVYRSGGSTKGSWAYTTNTWFFVEIVSTTTAMNWYVNGAKQGGADFSQNFGRDYDYWGFRFNDGLADSGKVAFYAYDVVLDNNPNNTLVSRYAGGLPPRIDVLKPAGAGNSAQWTTGTSSLFSAVNERPNDGDTTYIGDATSGDASTFTCDSSATAGISGNQMNAVKVTGVIRAPSGVPSTKVRLRSGSTNSDTTAIAPTATYVSYAQIAETDPNTAAAWTQAAIDALQVGVVNNASVAARCTQLMASVLSTPQTPGNIGRPFGDRGDILLLSLLAT